jgi:hypothetical protein
MKDRTSPLSSENVARWHSGKGFFSRDSGIRDGSGSRSGSMTSASGRRLRLADLRRDEEDRELRLRGRKSVEAM